MKHILIILALIFQNLLTANEAKCPDSCLSYFDGCNSCDCSNSKASHCTSRTCRANTIAPASCTKCDSNFEWNECGSMCTKTCDDPEPVCIAQCVAKCECPSHKPIFSNGVCIPFDECVTQQTAIVCPDDCATYFDGCNTCTCNSDGTMTCSSNTCTTYGEPYCIECKNNLEWTSCGTTCTQTCNNVNSECDSNSPCVSRCQCPKNKPIYRNGVCISANECFNFQNVCPINCTTYFDGCNNCTCLNGDDACTNKICKTKSTPTCTNCTGNLVWNPCGSDCTPTCTDPNPKNCSTECVPRCECTADLPYYHNGYCVTAETCSDPPPTTTIPQCPFGCETYFDGCNTCACNSNGTLGKCTTNVCAKYSEPTCLTCQNNLQWNNCSTCIATCNNTNACDKSTETQCVARCECPPDSPIYHNGKCISAQYCNNFQEICPGNCTRYFDGCNICECYDYGLDACTNNLCVTKTSPKCLNCEHGFAWSDCTSPCMKLCENPTPSCGPCVSKCDCPVDKPIYKNGTCIAYTSCNCQCQSVPLPNGAYVSSRTRKCASLTDEKSCKNIKTCIWKCH